MAKKNQNLPAVMTEAEIEARINAALSVAFPSLVSGRISHQTSFSVRLGHTALKVDGTKVELLRGRLDILIELDGTPLAILEIKGPGELLDNQVSQQGLSYARVLDSSCIPPLVVVTNGKDCRFFRTWDGSEWQAKSRDDQAFQSLFSEAAETSAENIDKAVKQLLNIIPGAWPAAIRRYTKSEIELITGYLEDLTCPVAKDFNIPRKVTVAIANGLHRGFKKLALTGDPFSGKTNVFANLTEHPGTEDFCFLYVNLASSSEGIFDRIASVFSEEFFRTFEKQSVKTWIVSQLPRISESVQFVVLVDGLDSNDHAFFKADLDTLSRHANEGRLSLVVSGHEGLIKSLAKVKGTNLDSALGKNLVTYSLDVLDNHEWMRAAHELNKARRAAFQSCADYVFELRHPRLLRLLASTIKSSEFESRSEDEISVIWSVCRPEWFKGVWDSYPDFATRDGFSRIAEVLLNQDSPKSECPDYSSLLKLATLNVTSLESAWDAATRTSFQERGFLQLVFHDDGTRYYLPKVPELLITAASQIVARQTEKIFRENGKDGAFEHLIAASEALPYSGIACALALIFLGQSKPELFNSMITLMLVSEPTSQKLGVGSKFAIAGPEGTVVELEVTEENVDDFEEGVMYGNQLPWLALSYLASRLKNEHSPKVNRSQIIEQVGSYPFVITGTDQSPQAFGPSLPMHELPGGISLLCGPAAMLEPIVMAACLGFLEQDRSFLSLCEKAIEADNIPLIWRLRSAATNLFDTSEDGIDGLVRQFAEKLDKRLTQCLSSKEAIQPSAPSAKQY